MGQTLQPAQVKSGNVRDGVLGGVVSLTNSSVKCIKIPCSVESIGANAGGNSQGWRTLLIPSLPLPAS